MGFCDIRFMLRSYRFHGHQVRPRKRSEPHRGDPHPTIQPFTFSVFGWFQNMTAVAGLMTWFGIFVVCIDFQYLRVKTTPLTRRTLPTDVPPLPSRVGRPRSRSIPPPIQIPPPALRSMVRACIDRNNPPPQRVLRLPPR